MNTNDVVLFDAGTQAVSTRFQGMLANIGDDLSGGVGGGFAVMSIKGGRFRVKYQGQETMVTDSKGDPVASVEAVIVKANSNLTKQYYESGYTEGDNSAPVCFSLDGKVPSTQAPQPQHATCAMCPKNAFGSKVNPDTGKKSKACQDNRKLAILPLQDLKNELYGGPMLLRVPAAALKDLANFNDHLKARGYPYNGVAVRIGFDVSVAYPKPVFKAIRVLDDAEAEQVLEWYESDAVQKILADFDADLPTTATPPPAKDELFEQPPPAKAATPPPPPAAKPAAKAPPPPPAAAAKPATATFGAKPAAAKPAAKAPPPPPAATVVTTHGQTGGITAAEVNAGTADLEPEVVPGNLEADIASILSDLNGIAGGE